MKIGVEEIKSLAIGAAILGAGGGGDPYVGMMMAVRAIEENGEVELLNPLSINDDMFIIPTAMMGAPTIMNERIPSGGETIKSLRALEKHLGRHAEATMPIESGGINSTIPFNVAARTGLPVVDADGMGRAFPELQMETFHIYGISGSPAAITDERGNTCILNTVDNYQLEWLARGVTIRMGGASHLAEYPMTGKDVKTTGIHYSVSLGIRIGDAVRGRGAGGKTPIERLMGVTEGTTYGKCIPLFKGKILDVERRTTAGFAIGSVTIVGLDEYQGKTMKISFQNENLVANCDGEVVASVPDIISILDSDRGLPITSENLRYGFRVQVIGIPTPEIMRTPAALMVWGPRYFGYDFDFIPLELRHKEYYSNARLPPEKMEKYHAALR
ncbi:MAG: DUF917 domain-containing protein [Nitrososphaerota archaeon]